MVDSGWLASILAVELLAEERQDRLRGLCSLWREDELSYTSCTLMADELVERFDTGEVVGSSWEGWNYGNRKVDMDRARVAEGMIE